MKNKQPLHVKLRPKNLGEVIGQDPVVSSLESMIIGKRLPHAFLFTGPSGVGKTSLARILALELECDNSNLIEVDAATYSGIDVMRELTSLARYKALAENPTRFFIIDECHALSKATWQSLLLALEEPAPHVYWALCTTEDDKVPQTIKSRCHVYNLRPVPTRMLVDYLDQVKAREKIDSPNEVVDLCAKEAMGSVRTALVYLSITRGCESRSEAYKVIASQEENSEVIELIRMIVTKKGLTWEAAMSHLQRLGDQSAESIRINIVNYLAKVLLGEKKGANLYQLHLLNLFSTPYNASDKMAPLILAIGKIIYQESRQE